MSIVVGQNAVKKRGPSVFSDNSSCCCICGQMRTLDRLVDDLSLRRQTANRIGSSRIACQRERLAAATTKIDVALWTRATRLLHPLPASKQIENFRLVPDGRQRFAANI